MNTNNSELFRVDLEKVIRAQKNKFLRKLPKFVLNYLKKLIREKELNEIVTYAGESTGIEFIQKCMHFMNVKIITHNKENFPKKGKFIFVCNHPLGGIDFFAAILSVAENYKKLNVIANEILTIVTPLNDIFLPVSIFRRNSEKDKEKILNKMSDANIQIMTFPAGLVSRKYKGEVKDSRWHRSFVRNSIEFKRDVIPLFIDAENSKKFYRFSRMRKFFRIKTNLELFLLPQELIKQKNSVINIYFGKPIPYETFNDSKEHIIWAQEVKNIVYRLRYQN